jgi:aspartyl-tRNA(Asn)/glutamyl-tRNA(Gln) amidotransferase subunit B
MTDYEMVIGVEVHAQLRTETKMFCGCASRFGAPPNSLVCPVCAGLPGSLPVPNRRAFDLALRVAVALGCAIAPRTRFDRKNYFYPDLPKNYQISQYDRPLGSGGRMDVDLKDRTLPVRIRRIHLEEDSGKNLHDQSLTGSFVDFNRSGIPLLEIVTEPDFRSPEEARAYLQELRRLLVWLEVSDGNMEEGSLRCEPNVSIRPRGQAAFGVKTELKNLNSFGAVERALHFEAKRQAAILDGGGRVVQSTLLWDPVAGETRVMRTKEEAHDYRYFPDPDLYPVEVGQDWVDRVRASMPELPRARRERFAAEFGLPRYDAEVLTQERPTADFFEACARAFHDPRKAGHFLMVEVKAYLNEAKKEIGQVPVGPDGIARLLTLVEEGAITPLQAKDGFRAMADTGKSADEVRAEKGLVRISDDDAIARVVAEVVEEHPEAVEDVRKGKEKKAVGFLMGQIVRRMEKKVDPRKTNELLVRELRRRAGSP